MKHRRHVPHISPQLPASTTFSDLHMNHGRRVRSLGVGLLQATRRARCVMGETREGLTARILHHDLAVSRRVSPCLSSSRLVSPPPASSYLRILPHTSSNLLPPTGARRGASLTQREWCGCRRRPPALRPRCRPLDASRRDGVQSSDAATLWLPRTSRCHR